MNLKFTWIELALNKNINIIEKNIIEYNKVCYKKCIKCNGSGNVIWGKCYDCNGYGIFGYENIFDYNKRMEYIDEKNKKYYESIEYLIEVNQEKYMSLVKKLEENDIVTEWESNFCNDMYCKYHNKLSVKQKEMLIKISKKIFDDENIKKLKELLKI